MIEPRLALEPLCYTDTMWLFELERDPEVMRYTDRGPQTLTNIVEQMPELVRGYDKEDALKLWLVCHPNLGRIGTAAFYVNPQGESEVGYKLHRQFWGQGLGKATLCALLEWVAKHRPNEPLVAEVFKENIASTKVLQRFGFEVVKEYWNHEHQLWDQHLERACLSKAPLSC